MAKLTTLSLGWGVQSWTLAAMSALGELPRVDLVLHADTTWERVETYMFARRWTPWLEAHGLRVITVTAKAQAAKVTGPYTDPPFFVAKVIADPAHPHVYIPAFAVRGGKRATRRAREGQLLRQCTHRWKIIPQRRFIRRAMRQRGIKLLPGVVEKWLGISLDEWWRAKDSEVAYIAHRYPLLDRRMTRDDCIAWLTRNGLEVPPKSACVFCPYHDRTLWQEIRDAGGQDWQTAVMVDAAIRDKRPPYPLYVHRARVPLPEAVSLALPDDAADAITCDSGYCFL